MGDGSFVRFPFIDETYLELRLLATERHRLSCEATRFRNRLQGMLDLAWPEYLEHFSDLSHATPIALLERWPVPADLADAYPPLVRRVARDMSRNHYSEARVAKLLGAAHRSVGLREGQDVRRKTIVNLLKRWALVRAQIDEIDIALTARVERCPAAKALVTIPEINAVCAATIVAEIGTPEDYESPRQVLKLAGMNLVEKSSGSYRGRTRQSKRGRPELRRQLFLLAARWVVKKRHGLYREDYEALLARNGGCKTKAVCAIARKLVPLILEVAKSQEPFDLERWRAMRRDAHAGAVGMAG